MLKRILGLFVIWMFASVAYGQEQAQDQAESLDLKAALWLGDIDNTKPSWYKDNVQPPQVEQTAEVLAYGKEILLARAWNGQVFVVSSTGRVLGSMQAPFSVLWWGLDANDKIITYDGTTIWAATTWQESQKEAGFFKLMQAPETMFIELAGNQLVLSDKERLRVFDLGTGAELALSYTQITGTTAPPQAQESSLTQFEPLGLWWRHDGVGLLRLRHLLDSFVYITRDSGKTWERMDSAPTQLQRVGAWIWDTKSSVLSADARTWVGLEITQTDNWASIFDLAPTPGALLNLRTLNFSSPQAPQAITAAPSPKTSPEQDAASVQEAQNSLVVYAPLVHGKIRALDMDQSAGLKPVPLYGFLQDQNCTQIEDAQCVQGSMPQHLVMVAESARMVDLPAQCKKALWTKASNGIVLLACAEDEQSSSVFVKNYEDGQWIQEGSLPSQVFVNPKLRVGSDGSLAVLGLCEQSTNATAKTEQGQPGSPENEANNVLSASLCYTAIRHNLELGSQDAWQLERVAQAYDIIPHAAQTLYLAKNTDGSTQLWRTTGMGIESLVPAFDMSPYDEAMITADGCVELRGRGGSVLLAKDGSAATQDCALSKQGSVEGAVAPQEQEMQAIGDDRFGIRVGGAGFFASGGVKTWAMRVEGLFPIYGGQYEIAAIFRLGGGNKATAMGYLGLLAARWRYDGLERFDFAIGAGIGFGSLCGYAKPASDENVDPVEGEETQTTKTSGYQKCSNLSIRYLISGVAAWKFAKNWKLYLAVELIGGSAWGVDVGGGLEVRF